MSIKFTLTLLNLELKQAAATLKQPAHKLDVKALIQHLESIAGRIENVEHIYHLEEGIEEAENNLEKLKESLNKCINKLDGQPEEQ